MNRIDSVFEHAGHKALVTYVTVGYPSVEATLKVVPLLAGAGADIIELGVPFSDPLADGVTIQRASFHALQNGVTLETCLDVAAKLRHRVQTPLVFMSYFNPLLQHGLDRLCRECNRAGVDGLIIPDLPPEEGGPLEKASDGCGVDIVYLLAPTSTPQRIRLVAEHSRGFIYLVSVTGVTGARQELPDLTRFVARVRKITKRPLCVGFGIATPEQAAQVAEVADGIIVGSRLVQLMEEDPSLERVAALVRSLRKATDR
jgi:tryptophan synthase alpha chain